MNVKESIEIGAPREAVWKAISDIEHCEAMISGIESVEILERPTADMVGLKWRETRVIFGKEAVETMWITEAEDKAYYQTRADNHGSIYRSRMAVEDSGSGTLLSMSFESEAQTMMAKIMSVLMSVFMKKSMKKWIRQDLEDIKQWVEAQSS